jgi:hypothetical protein
MQFTTFKPGDIVTVQPSEHWFWMDGLNHAKAQFVVKETYENEKICCAGHPQGLVMTDGQTVASGAWFDPLIIEKKWCNEKHSYSDYD